MNAQLQPSITTGLASQGGHWYASDGSPAYEILGKNGKLRAVTLRDARTMNLFPGVTGILACAAKPQLENWKIDQALMSALTLPRIEWENDSDFMARAKEDSKEQARRAAERGTLLHGQIEQDFDYGCDPEYAEFVRPVRAWLNERFGAVRWNAERSFSHTLGYGGKVDLHSDEAGVVIDFKTKDFGPDNLPKGYDEQGMQLAAYAIGLELGAEATRINLFISTRVPGLIVPVEWHPDTFQRHWDMFQALLMYWQADRKYAPRAKS